MDEQSTNSLTKGVANLFVFGPPTEPNSYIPLSGRDNRDFGPKGAESGGGHQSVDVSRDLGGETEPRVASSQLVASSGVCTKKADVVSVGFVS